MKNKLISSTETVGLFSGLIGLSYFLSTLPTKEVHTDVLWYLNMGFNNISDPRWLTRYTHVYIEKLFLFLIDDPLGALHYYWIFLIVFSTGLIYILTRLTNEKSNIINGGLSTVFFLSFGLLGNTAGVAWADMTSMFIVLLTSLIFYLSTIYQHKKKLLLYLLGAFFIIAFKTKETAWVISILFLGLSVSAENKVDINLFLNRLKHVFGGILVGIFIFMILNYLFLGDILFDFRFQNLNDYFSFWIKDSEYYEGSQDWYRNGIFILFPLIFFLYLYRGYKIKIFEYKMIWIYPIILILFLTIGMIKNTYVIYPRFLFPAIGIASIFAAQALEFDFPKTLKKQLQFWSFLIVGLLIYQVIYNFLINYISSTGVNFQDFVGSVIQPIALSGIIIYLLFVTELSYKSAIIPIILIISFLRPNITNNLRLAKWEPANGISQKRFYPLDVFGGYINISEDMLINVFPSMSKNLGFLSQDIDTIRTIFDLHYLVSTERKNYSVVSDIDTFIISFVNNDTSYIFMTVNEWNEISTMNDNKTIILEKCISQNDNLYEIIFFDCR